VLWSFGTLFVAVSLSTVLWLKIVFTRYETTTALPVECTPTQNTDATSARPHDPRAPRDHFARGAAAPAMLPLVCVPHGGHARHVRLVALRMLADGTVNACSVLSGLLPCSSTRRLPAARLARRTLRRDGRRRREHPAEPQQRQQQRGQAGVAKVSRAHLRAA
jgi:hypothetical protein